MLIQSRYQIQIFALKLYDIEIYRINTPDYNIYYSNDEPGGASLDIK